MAAADEILIVSDNIDRYHAYRRNRQEALERVCRGIYMRQGMDREKFFQSYGLRIAKMLFPSASLSYATAFLRKPRMGRVYVTGQYQYQRQLFDKSDRFVIVQSIGALEPENSNLHSEVTLKDPYGSFRMLCDTPELTLLNMMTATKRHHEKHLDGQDLDDLVDMLTTKHKGKGHLVSALQVVAESAGRENEFKRILQLLYDVKRK